MNTGIIIAGTALTRGVLGWLENSLADGKIDLPEFKKLGETVIRMGTPMVALIWGLNVSPAIAAGIVTVMDIVITKLYNAIKTKKK